MSNSESNQPLDAENITIGDKVVSCPIVTGVENEKALDISSLRNTTGYVTYDEGYANTASCLSSITYIDGDKGILRYRGIPVKELAESWGQTILVLRLPKRSGGPVRSMSERRLPTYDNVRPNKTGIFYLFA